MADDLVKRLRFGKRTHWNPEQLCSEAADRIEELGRHIEALKRDLDNARKTIFHMENSHDF